MKEPRTEKLVAELKETVNRLNRLDTLLTKSDVSYTLYRKSRDSAWLLEDVIQKVDYTTDE